ncbi:MAG: ribosomal protein S18 acetylase RimI-like enzyme [Glaciecola sp.]|jgi:ribosomal protein S18 acetylase RimI-like enzyme
MSRRPRWRTATGGELHTVREKLATWPCDAGGVLRHMFALASIEAAGPGAVRLATDDEGWAAAVVQPGRLLVPMGDPETLRLAGPPTRRWRLLVGDAAASDAILDVQGREGLVVHHQRFMALDHEQLPSLDAAPDPGFRLAVTADIEALAQLAVQLHIDDEFGPHPGRSGLRGYADRLRVGVEHSSVWCVGPIGAPEAKLERSVSSHRHGVQFSGIVVAPESRGRGIGKGMVAAAVRAAAHEGPRGWPVALHVRADNARAIATYERCGFRDREEWRLAVRP